MDFFDANPRCKFEKTCRLETRKFLRRWDRGQVGRTAGACIKWQVDIVHQCIMVMEDSKKSFRDLGVKKHNFFVQIVYGLENLHPLKTSQHQGTIIRS